MNVQATFAATLFDEWARSGVTDVVVSPGSRSTPLALAAAGDSRLRLHVVLDERSAGFFAVGLGLATGRPAVVVTTSGTAAVELHPAVVEADLAAVPLLLCTADRPPELHTVGAPQTVEQRLLFAEAVRWAFDPGVPDEAAAGSWRSLAARTYAEAAAGPPGPVHLNLPFRDPLTGEPGPLPPGRPDGAPWHVVTRAVPVSTESLPDGVRGVIVAGGGAGNAGHVQALAEAMGWPVLADPRSGCRLPHRTTVAAADAILRARRFEPEFVLRLGAPWASKVVNQWLASLDPAVPQWLVDPDRLWRDPERLVHRALAALPSPGAEPAPSDWLDAWATAEAAAQRAITDAVAGEPAIARNLVRDLPDGANLVVSSSMPIRDVEWYAEPRTGIRVFANRGANGIDGVLSTALGVAAGSPGRSTFALVGDLAFLHDVGALATAARRTDLDCTFVVVDNGGGGIFSFLPQAESLPADVFEQLFGTPHGVNLEAIAHAFGANVRVLVSDRSDNVSVHSQLHDAVAKALSG